jgi:glycerol dehydrogenase-like iron-containing ADH family enzyme
MCRTQNRGEAMTVSWPLLEKGSGALKAVASAWRNFAVVTTPSPWALTQASLPAPCAVIFATDLKRQTLEALRTRIRGANMIVGIGSGLSMDTAKYLAKAEQTPLAQILTTSSNNACFTRTAWTFEGEARVPERDVPIPRQLILDYDLLARAPARMNRAGAAEILCSHTALFDWQLARQAGVDVQWDDDLHRSTQQELDRLDHYAPAIGADRIEAFVEIIEVGAKFARGFTSHPKARFNGGSEHVLAWALEQQGGQRLIHRIRPAKFARGTFWHTSAPPRRRRALAFATSSCGPSPYRVDPLAHTQTAERREASVWPNGSQRGRV